MPTAGHAPARPGSPRHPRLHPCRRDRGNDIRGGLAHPGASGYVGAMRDEPSPRRNGHPQAPGAGAPAFLWILVGVMAAIEAALGLSEAGYLGSFNWRWPALAMGAFWAPVLTGAMDPLYPGQTLAMFLTYAFLHGGLAHLLLNSVVLLALGKFVADRIGAGRTLLLLVLSAMGGALAFGLLSDGGGPMIGASAAVFGLLGLWQAWDYRMRRRAGLTLRPVITAILALAAVNIILVVILGGGIAWEAHLGGWLVGWGAAWRLAAPGRRG